MKRMNHGILSSCQRTRGSPHRLSVHRIFRKLTMADLIIVSQLLRWVMCLNTVKRIYSRMATCRRKIPWNSPWYLIDRWMRLLARCEQENFHKVVSSRAFCLTLRKLKDFSKASLDSVDKKLKIWQTSSPIAHKSWSKRLLFMGTLILMRIKWMSPIIGKII